MKRFKSSSSSEPSSKHIAHVNDVVKQYVDEIDRIIGKTDINLIAADQVIASHVSSAVNAVKDGYNSPKSMWTSAKRHVMNASRNGGMNLREIDTDQPSIQRGIAAEGSAAGEINIDDDDEQEGREEEEEGAAEEEVRLLSQPPSAGVRSLFGVKSLVSQVKNQCVELKGKIDYLNSDVMQTSNKNYELRSHIEELEGDIESIKLYQNKLELELKTASSNALGSNGGRVGKHQQPNNNTSNNGINDNLRMALMSVEDTVDVNMSMDQLRKKGIIVFLSNILFSYFIMLLPFKRELKEIESKFGSSILSYFLFCRFIFMQFTLLSLIVVVFAVFHMIDMLERNGWESSILLSRGTMPGFMYMSSYDTNENIYYSSLVIIILLVLLVSTIDEAIREDKIAKESAAIEAENSSPYATEVFASWDFTQITATQRTATTGILSQTYLTMLDSTQRHEKISKRTRREVIFLWLRRCSIMFVYFSVQLVAIVIFLYFSFYADKVIQSASNSPLAPISKYIQSITFQVISTLMPIIADFSTDLERWDSGHVLLLIQLIRNYVSNTINTLVVTISYYVYADPFLFATTPTLRSISMSDSSSLPCKLDHTADIIFTLVLTTFISNLVSFVLMPFVRYAKAYYFGEAFVPMQFDVANNIVNILLFIGVLFVMIPFSPLSMLLAPLFIYVTIKWQCYWILVCYRKPKKPWKAYQAMPLFSMFYLFTLILLCILPSFYFLSTKTFPKSCSLQDKYVHLCSDAVTNDVCTMDTASKYFAAYGTTSYPAAICSNACGAFVADSNNFASIKEEIFSVDVLGIIYKLLFSYSYISWIVCVGLIVLIARLNNSIHIFKRSSANKDRIYEAKIMRLEAELVASNKKLEKLQAIDEERALIMEV